MTAEDGVSLPSRLRRWQPYIVAGSIAILVAAIGGAVTEIGPWYEALRKPSFQPPDWLFGPAWTVIFTLTAISAATAWQSMQTIRGRTLIVTLFLFNVTLNVLWSVLFFAVKRPDHAMVEVIFLWASIAALIVVLWPRSQRAALLLVPYLAWVTFASLLNLAILQLNAPI
jgi:benzodiazapine receptor